MPRLSPAARAARNAEIVRRYLAGESPDSLAVALGLARSNVYLLLRRVGAGYPERRTPAEPRFWAKVQKSDGCWLWTGSVRRGYGQFGVSATRHTTAHRFSWELHNGPVPKGEGYHGTCVLHHCDTPRCVRPDRLFLGTIADNTHDMIAKGRGKMGQYLKAKTHCKRGHPFDQKNTYHSNAGRVCRACRRMAEIASKARRCSALAS